MQDLVEYSVKMIYNNNDFFFANKTNVISNHKILGLMVNILIYSVTFLIDSMCKER